MHVKKNGGIKLCSYRTCCLQTLINGQEVKSEYIYLSGILPYPNSPLNLLRSQILLLILNEGRKVFLNTLQNKTKTRVILKCENASQENEI